MGLGHFLTEEQIAAMNPQRMSHGFTTTPELTLDWTQGRDLACPRFSLLRLSRKPMKLAD
jgi:hypothetical protein